MDLDSRIFFFLYSSLFDIFFFLSFRFHSVSNESNGPSHTFFAAIHPLHCPMSLCYHRKENLFSRTLLTHDTNFRPSRWVTLENARSCQSPARLCVDYSPSLPIPPSTPSAPPPLLLCPSSAASMAFLTAASHYFRVRESLVF